MLTLAIFSREREVANGVAVFEKGQEYAGSGDFACGFFQEFVDKGLVRFGLFGGHAAELAKKFWGDTDGDELFGVAGGGAADSAGATEFRGGRFGNVREIDPAIRHRLCALCASPGER